MEDRSVLIVVDMQNDFMPGGALAVSDGDKIIPRLNEYIRLFQERNRPVVATRDWHPPKTTHFLEFGGPWPPHCIQGTRGAELHPALALPEEVTLLSKGMDPSTDAYSAFHAQDAEGRPLREILEGWAVRHIYIGGLALDYCVKWSSLDALEYGVQLTVLIDATRAVNVHVHDAELAIEELVRNNARLATIETLDR
jgi:nicotinamidase/pyrazinamidase